MIDKFPIGSVVRLKSGGPKMTVVAHHAYSHEIPYEDRYAVTAYQTPTRLGVWCDYSPDNEQIMRWSGYPDCLVPLGS